jgi:hypothetical protein
VYIRRTEHSVIIIALYVDDILLAASHLAELEELKLTLTSKFEMEDLGEARFILGLEITRNRRARSISISQKAYIQAVLKKHITGQPHPQAIPMETSSHHVKATDEHQASVTAIRAYQSAIGSLMFAMLCTRPDIAFAVSVLSKFANNPTEEHQQGVQRVLRYLSGTTHIGITYTGEGSITDEPACVGYSDSDWAADRDDRRSQTGYAFTLCGGAISWQSKKQSTVALSSVEAEYMAVSATAKEALWWRTQLHSLGYDTTAPTTICSDSKGSIALAKNPDHHSLTKHIDMKYHFIRLHIVERAIRLEYLNTSVMAADLLTKALPRHRHESTAGLLGVGVI